MQSVSNEITDRQDRSWVSISQNFQFAFDCADPSNMYIETLVSYDWSNDLLVHLGLVFCSLMVSVWSEEWEGLGTIPLEIFFVWVYCRAQNLLSLLFYLKIIVSMAHEGSSLV